MSHGNQHTIKNRVSVEGIGVHSGAPATLAFCPASPDHGIRFKRTDLDGEPEIPVDLDHVAGTELGTSLGEGDVRVQTVEHVMAALSARGIDNAVLELSGPEPPILDGSFKGYLDTLEQAGMGTTLAAATLDNDLIHVAHVGDSRLYRLTDDSLIRLTTDHSWVSELQQTGALSEKEAATFTNKNIIVSSFIICSGV